mmetsp:Transcript_15246/g.32735  ORF Transcript_15246/g.32735 Transcript_15246/m.32735 type:complete len:248 (+) Transcript_15246:2553-3296(+)
MQSELRCLPLLRGLEHQRQGTHVRSVELLQSRNCLRMILLGRSSHESKPSQRNDAVDVRSFGSCVVEEAVHGDRKVKTARKHWNHTRATRFQLRDKRSVVAAILCDHVRALHDNTNGRRVLGEVCKRHMLRLIPLVVLIEVFEHLRCNRMPNSDVRIHFRVHDLSRDVGSVREILIGEHEKEVLHVLWRAAQPILERHHEGARVLCLVTWKILEHLGQRAKHLEHSILKRRTGRLLLLLHERRDGRL